jgi:hypothetical protein
VCDAGVMVQSDVWVHRIGTGVMVSWLKVNVDGSLDAGTASVGARRRFATRPGRQLARVLWSFGG